MTLMTMVIGLLHAILVTTAMRAITLTAIQVLMRHVFLRVMIRVAQVGRHPLKELAAL
jgi:hypothetical protein